MSETPESLARPERARRLFRSLLPVLVNVALLGAMIGAGIHRNRARLAGNRSQLDDAHRLIQTYADSAVRFLEQSQSARGSWQGGRDEATTTAHVLLSLKSTRHRSSPFFARGLSFLRELAAEGVARPPSVVLASWLLLEHGALSFRDLQALMRESSHGIEETTLLRLVARSESMLPPPMEGGALRPSESLLVACLSTSLSSPNAGQDLDRVRALLNRFRTSLGPEPWSALDSAALAAYAKTRSHVCLLEPSPCNDLNSVLGTLMARRRPDGSWDSAGGLEGYASSPVETTAMVVAALEAFQGILEIRGGAPPPR